jgi:hypothetical protein
MQKDRSISDNVVKIGLTPQRLPFKVDVDAKYPPFRPSSPSCTCAWHGAERCGLKIFEVRQSSEVLTNFLPPAEPRAERAFLCPAVPLAMRPNP